LNPRLSHNILPNQEIVISSFKFRPLILLVSCLMFDDDLLSKREMSDYVRHTLKFVLTTREEVSGFA